MGSPWKFESVSDSAILISPQVSSDTFCRLLALQTRLPAIENLHPAFASLLVEFDPNQLTFSELTERIEEVLDHKGTSSAFAPTVEIKIPVVYGDEEGPDLIEVAGHLGLSPEEVIRRHSEVVYEVAFLGFSPGFPYLLGLPEALICPRKKTPRIVVKAGSVAIGGRQAGIYPEDSPGGWQIIGRTQLKLFASENTTDPTLLHPGDLVRFVPVFGVRT